MVLLKPPLAAVMLIWFAPYSQVVKGCIVLTALSLLESTIMLYPSGGTITKKPERRTFADVSVIVRSLRLIRPLLESLAVIEAVVLP